MNAQALSLKAQEEAAAPPIHSSMETRGVQRQDKRLETGDRARKRSASEKDKGQGREQEASLKHLNSSRGAAGQSGQFTGQLQHLAGGKARKWSHRAGSLAPTTRIGQGRAFFCASKWRQSSRPSGC